MKENIPNSTVHHSHEGTPGLVRLPLAERATTPELQELYKELTAYADATTEKLLRAYGPAPSEGEVANAAEMVSGELKELALRARAFGVHYDGFHVGGALLGYNFSTTSPNNPWVILFDANTKPTKADAKWCAEQYLLDRIETSEEHVERVLSIVISGGLRSDDVSGKTQITLSPCKICRDRLTEKAESGDGQISPQTEVITIRSDARYLQKIQRVRNLKAFHGEPGSLEMD